MPPRRILPALLCIALCVPACQAASISDFLYRTHRTVYDTLAYRLFVPAGYNPATRYPIILTFHGVGERGSDNVSQLNNNVVTPWIADSVQTRVPCFIVSPQCPGSEQWADFSWSAGIYQVASTPISNAMRTVISLLDSLKREYSLDTNRFYVTGLSMGGCGTWDIIARYPNLFAAAVPCCGVGDSTMATDFQRTAIWAFHGAADGTVPPSGSRLPMAAIQRRGETVLRYTSTTSGGTPNMSWDTLTARVNAGSRYLYTEYTDGGHGIWNNAFLNPLLPNWLFSKTKGGATPVERPARGLAGRSSAGPVGPCIVVDLSGAALGSRLPVAGVYLTGRAGATTQRQVVGPGR